MPPARLGSNLSAGAQTEPLRSVLLLTASGLFLYFTPIRWGALWNFPLSLLLIVPIVTWLSSRRISASAQPFFLCLLLLPALGYTFWKRQILSLDLEYIVLQQGAAHTLRLTQYAAEGVAALVCVAAVFISMVHKRLGMLCIAIAGTCAASRYLLYGAAFHLDQHSVVRASQLIATTELLRFVPVTVGLILLSKAPPRERSVLFGTTLLGGWLSAPLVGFILWNLPAGQAHPNAPEGKEQLGVAMMGADIDSPQFSEQLNAQDTTLFSGWGWWCNTDVRENWKKNTRATAALALDKDKTLSDLRPHLPEILFRGVTRLAFIGKASSVDSLPPLRKHLRHPAARWLLDPAPEEAHNGVIQDNTLKWEQPLPDSPAACAIHAHWDTRIDTLFSIGTELDAPNGPCAYKLFLIFGPPTTTWSPPLPCTKRPHSQP